MIQAEVRQVREATLRDMVCQVMVETTEMLVRQVEGMQDDGRATPRIADYLRTYERALREENTTAVWYRVNS